MRLRPPPGIVLEPGEVLDPTDFIIEWIAYGYDTRFDVVLAIAFLAGLYDVLWTPCLFLLPIETGGVSLAVGFVIDATFFLSAFAM